jgi:hypothetical protein
MTTSVCCPPTAARSAKSRRKQAADPAWHAGFLKLLPAIRRHARISFRRLPAGTREEAVSEVVADAFIAYARLHSMGKSHLAYGTALARYGVGHFREGRRVGGQANANDVTSGRCLRKNGVVVEPLWQRDPRRGGWREIVVEDGQSGPAEIAAMRLDFADWLKTLSARDRRIAERLAIGESTATAARMFRVSRGRISQLRREFFEGWHKFVGELVDVRGAAAATA